MNRRLCQRPTRTTTRMPALLLALFYYGAFRAWRRVRRFFLLRILEKRSAIPQHWRRYLGNIEVRLYAVLVIFLGYRGRRRLAAPCALPAP